MSDDIEFLKNYLSDTLYVHPGREGAYATLVSSQEETPLGEIEITDRTRLAVSAFYVGEKADFGTLKITKLKWDKRRHWHEDGHIKLNRFHTAHLRAFVSLIASLDLKDAPKGKIRLTEVSVEALATILSSSRGLDMIKEISESTELREDIYAVATKRQALAEFERLLRVCPNERTWQDFFERNTWIFGHGLNYIFVDKVANKLEARTTGSSFDRAGKTADALMRTRAEVSQYVLVEIKKSNTELLQSDTYRAGCWSASSELSDAVTQAQKTVFEFTRDRFRDQLRDSLGDDLGIEVYAVEPRSYLVIGDLNEIAHNQDKIICFELYRRNIRAPEILTFDELYQRARCAVETVSRKMEKGGRPALAPSTQSYGDEVPF